MAPAWLEKFITRVDATPDPRRTNEQPTLEMHYTALMDHRRVIGMKGDAKPRYEVQRRSVLGAWGSKCDVTSLAKGNMAVATIDFHTLPASTEIQFAQDGRKVFIKMAENQYEPKGDLGRLHWKATGMSVHGKASWELRDDSNLVVSVTIGEDQANGLISFWNEKLDPETIEELLIVAISRIEEYRRLLRKSNTAAVHAVASATWLAV